MPRRFPCLGLSVLLAGLLWLLPAWCAAAPVEPPALWGVLPTPVDVAHNPEHAAIAAMWRDLRAREESAPDGLGEESGQMPGPTQKQWDNVKHLFPKMSAEEQLRTINGFFNRWSGLDDMETYGRKEYWAATREFLQHGGGDCEDYALIKYRALRDLGAKADALWLVLVTDVGRKADHAVLLAQVGERRFILDNLSSPAYLIMPPDAYKNMYVPRFALNNDGIWVYTPRGNGTVRPGVDR